LLHETILQKPAICLVWIAAFFKTEKNGQLQIGAALVAVIAGFILKIAAIEWLFILLCIALVLCLEMMNSAIEKLVDHLHPGRHDQVRWVKDVAAGSVLFASVISLIAGCVIFLPKIYLWFCTGSLP